MEGRRPRQHHRSQPGMAAPQRRAMVVYDSTVTPGEGQAVYMNGTAGPADIGMLEVFSRRAVRSGLGEWSPRRVSGKARLRLYRAEVHEWSILDPDADIDVRVRVSP